MNITKKLILRKLDESIKYWRKKLEHLFTLQTLDEDAILTAVRNIHCSILEKKKVMKNDYDIVERNEKVYYVLPSGYEACIANMKDLKGELLS